MMARVPGCPGLARRSFSMSAATTLASASVAQAR